MKRYLILSLLVGLAFILVGSVVACAKPAAFEVVSLDVMPKEITAGDTATVTTQVNNVGGSQGIYSATLTVDGAKLETKEVTVAPGASETVTFSLVKDIPGTYQVGIDELTSSLTVKQKLVAKEFELKYDDGQARDCVSAYVPWVGGHIVDFSPPASPFTIKKVRIAGMLYPPVLKAIEGKNFDVEIWDKDQKVLYSAAYPYTKFTVGATTWVEFEIPDIVVNDKFYAHIYTDSPFPGGLHIGADDSIINEHSDTTIRTAEGVASILAKWPYMRDWGWFGDKSKVNWMIRVVGTTMVPAE